MYYLAVHIHQPHFWNRGTRSLYESIQLLTSSNSLGYPQEGEYHSLKVSYWIKAPVMSTHLLRFLRAMITYIILVGNYI